MWLPTLSHSHSLAQRCSRNMSHPSLLPGRNPHRPKPRSPLKPLSMVSSSNLQGFHSTAASGEGKHVPCSGLLPTCCKTAAPCSLPFLAGLLLFITALNTMCKLELQLLFMFFPPFQVLCTRRWRCDAYTHFSQTPSMDCHGVRRRLPKKT